MNSQQYIAQLGDLPWSRVFVFGFVAVIFYYFLLYDDGSSLKANYAQETTRLSQAQKGLEDTKRAIADADKFDKEVKSMAAQFERIRDFMPEELGPATLTEIVSRQANQSGAKVVKMEPKLGDEKVDFYEMTRLNLNLEGNYSQLVSFLSLLSRVPKLLTFDRIKISVLQGQPDSPMLSFTGTLVGYRYLKPEPKADGAAAANGQNGGATNANK